MKANGIGDDNFTITRQGVQKIIREYTRESGVRNLEREIATVCRKVAKRIVWKGKETQIRVTSENVDKLLGVPRFSSTQLEADDAVGLVKGLAVTAYGGEVLEIEVAVVPGKGKLILTGLLGDWLKESATAGFSYIRSRADSLGLEKDFQEKFDFHVHYPGTGTKADGPSAGIAMATAMVSALLGRRVRKDIAMTGEITLRGRVLPIGGLKEKTMAAHRAGITRVLVPKQNEKDLQEIPRLRPTRSTSCSCRTRRGAQHALIVGPANAVHTAPPSEDPTRSTQVRAPVLPGAQLIRVP
jgi:ATP-dependent Lon protease